MLDIFPLNCSDRRMVEALTLDVLSSDEQLRYSTLGCSFDRRRTLPSSALSTSNPSHWDAPNRRMVETVRTRMRSQSTNETLTLGCSVRQICSHFTLDSSHSLNGFNPHTRRTHTRRLLIEELYCISIRNLSNPYFRSICTPPRAAYISAVAKTHNDLLSTFVSNSTLASASACSLGGDEGFSSVLVE